MKKTFLMLFWGMISLGTAAQTPKILLQEVQTKVKNVQQRRKGCGYTFPLRVGSFPANPPLAWVKEEAKNTTENIYTPEGAVIDLVRQIAQERDMSITFVGFSNYEKALHALIAGDIDMLAGLYYAPDMTGSSVKIMAPAFFKTSVMVWHLAGKTLPVKTLDDLAGYKGVVRQEEMIYPVLFKNLPKGADIQVVSGSETAFQMLLEGKCDYILGGLHSITTEKNRLKLGDAVVHNGRILKQFGLFLAFSGVSRCLGEQKALSQTLKQVLKQKPFDSFLVDGDNLWRSYFHDDTFARSMGISDTPEPETLDFQIMNIDLSVPKEKAK